MNDGPVTIQVPHVNRITVEVASEIEPGHTLLVGSLPTDDKRESLYLLLTPKLIRENAK
jgi:D-Tyr-tRNAtyr deacylase